MSDTFDELNGVALYLQERGLIVYTMRHKLIMHLPPQELKNLFEPGVRATVWNGCCTISSSTNIDKQHVVELSDPDSLDRVYQICLDIIEERRQYGL